MSDRQPPSEFTKAIVEGVGMLALIIVGMLVLSGMRSGSIRPAEIVAEIPVWRDTIMSYVPIVAGSAAALLVSVLVAVVATRYGRAMVNASAAVWWRYRRRWADAMATVGLVGKPAKKGAPAALPTLRSVALGPDADVLTVTMLDGQSTDDWRHRADALARALGATSGRVRVTTSGGIADIDLILEHGGPGGGPGLPEPKALPAPPSATLPGLVLDPAQASARPRQVPAAMRAWSLQIVWARIRVGEDNETGRWWFGGRVRWNMIERNGYLMGGV